MLPFLLLFVINVQILISVMDNRATSAVVSTTLLKLLHSVWHQIYSLDCPNFIFHSVFISLLRLYIIFHTLVFYYIYLSFLHFTCSYILYTHTSSKSHVDYIQFCTYKHVSNFLLLFNHSVLLPINQHLLLLTNVCFYNPPNIKANGNTTSGCKTMNEHLHIMLMVVNNVETKNKHHTVMKTTLTSNVLSDVSCLFRNLKRPVTWLKNSTPQR